MVGCGSFIACAATHLYAATNQIVIVETYTLPRGSLSQLGNPDCSEAALEEARGNGLKFTDLLSLGSGLAKSGPNELVGLTDRGPNGVVTENGMERRTFPLPQFCPTIVRLKLTNTQIQIVQAIPLTDAHEKRISGLSNLEGEARLFESADAKAPLPLDPDGVDTEGIRVFADGKFLLSEEYGPSLLVVNTNGEVLMRYMPQTKPLPGATYPVKPILPSVLAQRRDNRGIEALALSPDGRTAYAILQSPAGDEENKRIKNSRVARAIRLDVNDPLNARVTGHFLMPLSPAADYSPTLKQQNVKLNDAEWLAPDQLLVLESGKEFARLVVADFREATNLLGRTDENTLAFESVGENLSRLTVKPAQTEIWASTQGLSGFGPKLEGLAILSPTEIAVANDNDFGLGEGTAGELSRIWILRLNPPLPQP